MKNRIILVWIALLLIGLFCTVVFGEKKLSDSVYSHTDIAHLLGWRTGIPNNPKQETVCGGYYEEPNFITAVENPPSYKNTPVQITSQGSVFFQKNGDSVLQNNVRISQPGRLIRADKAIIHRDAKTGKIISIDLIGNVRVMEHGKFIASKSATFDTHHNKITMHDVVYRIAGIHSKRTESEPFDAWGTAQVASRESHHILDLRHASYTTCAPDNPAWHIVAKHIHLDKQKQKGYAKNATLYFRHIPVFWSPYYSFKLNRERKSGFLSPTLGYATKHGFYFTLPYYWNMAPNYDFLFTPEYYSLRGVLMYGKFRYISERSHGHLYASMISHDRQFSQFRTNTLNSFSGVALSNNLSPYISDLKNHGSTRGNIDFKNVAQWNTKWSSQLYLRYVTDPYFGSDFESPYLNQNINQLPSFGQLNYLGDHWQASFLAQTYQTLHLLSQFLEPAQNQYTRLPEVNLYGTYPQLLSGFNLDLSFQAVNFDYKSAYYPFTYQRPIGQRVHIRPSISHPFNGAAGYVTPKLSADSTQYFSQLPTTPGVARVTQNINRTLPIFDMDSGLYFDRKLSIGHHSFIQTLEPRFFYLYTPYLNQDAYPNFDTQILPFSFTDLYSLNRFAGFDRLQNANQLSMGLTSRILRQNDSSDFLTAQLGLIDYFDQPHVCLLPGCQNTVEHISPVVGALTFDPNPIWSMTSQVAWDTALHQMNNAQAGVRFRLDNRRIAVVNYVFTHSNQDTPFSTLGFTSNSSLLTLGATWPMTQRWSVFGYNYYNLTSDHPEAEYVGLAYNTCCWALRAVVENTYTGATQINGSTVFRNTYNTSYFLELLLIGLGSAGNQSAESLLSGTLPGFEDMFSNHSRYGYNRNV